MIDQTRPGRLQADPISTPRPLARGRSDPHLWRLKPLFPGFIVVATACLLAPSGAAQEVNYERDRQLATQPLVADIDAPDTTGFWFHVRRGELDRAREELTRLRALAPDWSPAPAILEALIERPDEPPTPETEDAASIALRAQEARMSRLAILPPNAYATIDARLLIRARAEAQRLGRADDLLLLSWIAIERGDIDGAQTILDDIRVLDPQLSTTDVRERITREQIDSAVARRDRDQIASFLGGPDSDPAAKALLGSAWSAFDHGSSEDALWRFRQLAPSADRALGEALSLRALGETAAAIDTACTDTLRNSDPALCRDWLAEALSARYAKGDYASAASIGARLDALGLLSNSSRELLAWSLLERGEMMPAAEQFEVLISALPQRREFADALLRALAGDPGRLSEVADDYALVRLAITAQRADLAFARKQFDLSASLALRTDKHRGDLELGAGLNWRRRKGETALATVDRREGSLDATAMWQDWRWRLRLNDSDYQMPAVEPGTWFASAPVNTPFPGLRQTQDIGVRAELAREYDGANVYLALAKDLREQPANESLTGQISFSLFDEHSTTAVTAYHRFREDTFLSRVGNLDRRTATRFGGAISTGLRGLYARSINADWGAAVSGQIENVSGDAIEDNRGWQSRLDLSRTRGGKSLDYWRTGPYLSYWHFDENLSDYSLGHGGYFSPDQFMSAGIASEILSLEGARWQVKAAASLGVGRIEQASYLRFPGNRNSERLLGRSATGLSGELKLQGQYRLSPRWRISGYLYHLDAIEFSSSAAGISLHFTPSGRSGVFSRDLPLENPWLKGFAL
ncbi:MAG: hypothetical protein ACI87W_001900 [Halieaceae bacterium]